MGRSPMKRFFGCKQLSDWFSLSRYQKLAYMPPPRLRRRVALDQRDASLTRKKGHRPFAKCCSALSEFYPRKPIFGCKQLSDWFSLSRYQKPAYMPPPRLRRRVALDQRDASLTRKSLPSVASNYQADFCSQGIKSRRTCRRLLMDYTF